MATHCGRVRGTSRRRSEEEGLSDLPDNAHLRTRCPSTPLCYPLVEPLSAAAAFTAAAVAVTVVELDLSSSFIFFLSSYALACASACRRSFSCSHIESDAAHELQYSHPLQVASMPATSSAARRGHGDAGIGQSLDITITNHTRTNTSPSPAL